jgi:hypothetical protein
MCIARIDENGSWKIKLALFHGDSRPEFFDQWFDCLIDTGAERTVLSLTAINGAGIDPLALKISKRKVVGVNKDYMETWFLDSVCLIFLNDRGNYHMEKCDGLLVADMETDDYFGLIGRDILNRFNISSDIENKGITITRLESIYPGMFKVINKEKSNAT